MITTLKIKIIFVCLIGAFTYSQAQQDSDSLFCGHKINLDDKHLLLPCTFPLANPYDYVLHARWNFLKTRAPLSPGPSPRSLYPQYYFYCAWKDTAGMMLPDLWMNDIGERIPNWFECARLYYAYTGDIAFLNLTKKLVDYSLMHGTSPGSFKWPNFPYTTTNAGELDFHGFTNSKKFGEHDTHVDHAGDLGFVYYRMYLLFREEKYKTAAINVANALAKNISSGDASNSPWPYVVNMKSGKTISEYGTNWFGCIGLLKILVANNAGDTKRYHAALDKVIEWMRKYPLKNNIWVDGHTDNFITGTGNLSNMSASNAGLYISDNTDFDREWKSTLPGLLIWTEDNFVYKSAPGEPSNFFGANLVSEQVGFMPKMDYQTARYAAQCARWYAFSGDESYKEKAFRALNFVTYCNDDTGKVFESPFSKGVNSWWSDCYGECPRMFFYVFSAIPEWAPAKENHILYAKALLNNISYKNGEVIYNALERTGTEYLRLSYKPLSIMVNGAPLHLCNIEDHFGYALKDLGNGDYAVTIRRMKSGLVVIKA